MRRGPITVGAAAVAMAILFVACGNVSSDSSSTEGGATAEGVDAGDISAAADGRPLPEQGDPVEGDRRVVYTARLRLRVDDPRASADEAADVAEEAGGDLDSQSEDADDEVQLTVRVPSDAFDEVVDELISLGTLLDRTVDTEDVTDQVVDLEGRLANAQASVERLRLLFDEAASVDQVVAVEAALSEREAEVEGLAGQLQVLEDQADRSTITVTFTREGEPEVNDDIPGFLQGLENGWIAFRNVLAVGVTVVGFLLPFLLVAVPVGLVLRWWVRRQRRNRPAQPTGSYAHPQPAPVPAASAPHPPSASTADESSSPTDPPGP